MEALTVKKRLGRLIATAFVCLAVGATQTALLPIGGSAAASSGGDVQLQSSNIAYVGYFGVPVNGVASPTSDADRFRFGGGAMWAGPTGAAPGTGTLYLSNDPRNYGRIGIINIPAVASWNGTIATVNTYLGAALSGNGIINENTGDYPISAQFSCSATMGSTSLTVSSVTTGTVNHDGSYLVRGAGIGAPGPGLAAGTTLTAGPTGGGAGTYTLSTAATSTASGTCYQNATEPVIAGVIPRSDGNLLVTYYWYYPGGTASAQYKNALILSSDLSTVLQYDQQIGDGTYDGSQAGGMTGTIATEWQSALGSSYLAGQGSIVANDSRGTIGPANYAINPNYTYGSGALVPTTALTRYPYTTSGTQEIVSGWVNNGNWPTTGTSLFVSGMDRGATTFIPTGFSSVVTVGVHGVGPYCYGDPTSTASLQRTPTGSGPIYCYDLGSDLSGSSDKGVHAYPYEYWVWLWNESDVASVKSGSLNPWQIYPYAAFQLPWPAGSGRTPGDAYTSSGAGYYDQSTGYLYMLMAGGNQEYIAVWKISTSSTTPCQIAATSLPSGTHGVAYSTNLSATAGCTAPLTWKLLYENPSYISELSMSTGGTLSGTMAETGTYDIVVEVTDTNGKDAMISLPLTLN